jgi:hypothetical protein
MNSCSLLDWLSDRFNHRTRLLRESRTIPGHVRISFGLFCFLFFIFISIIVLSECRSVNFCIIFGGVIATSDVGMRVYTT